MKVAIRPKTSAHNRYVDLFAGAFEQAGWDVAALTWRVAPVLAGRLMILHWPDEFYAAPDLRTKLRSWARILLMATSRRIFGVHWIWIVHNVTPHDQGQARTGLWRAFTGELDGLVFLSQQSRRAFVSEYPENAAISHLITRHGEYRTGAVTQPSPWRRPTGTSRLQFVGQIRPYKNLERLVDAARGLDPGTTISIAGLATNDFAAELRLRSEAISAVHLDLRPDALDELELEQTVDASDAVILPYRRILNSGMALFALSRNRPVIAPALGGLAELRDTVGDDWVYLYDGELTSEVLRDAAAWVRTADRQQVCRLDGYGWDFVGPEIVRFAASLVGNVPD